MKPTPILISSLLFFSSMASSRPMWKDQAYFDSLKKKRGIEITPQAPQASQRAEVKPSVNSPEPRKIVEALKSMSADEFKRVFKMDKPAKL